MAKRRGVTGSLGRVEYAESLAADAGFRRVIRGDEVTIAEDSEVVGPDDATLRTYAEAVAESLIARGQSMVAAESCTGGWIAKTLTDIAGQLRLVRMRRRRVQLRGEGVAARRAAADARTHRRGEPGNRRRNGVRRARALRRERRGRGDRHRGSSGGTPGKPVGTVWIGWKRRGGYARAELFHFDGDREAVRRQTVAAALEGVRRILTS